MKLLLMDEIRRLASYELLIPFCSCPPSQSLPSEDRNLGAPSRVGMHPFAGVPLSEWGGRDSPKAL
jgi:hypothetical protein